MVGGTKHLQIPVPRNSEMQIQLKVQGNLMPTVSEISDEATPAATLGVVAMTTTDHKDVLRGVLPADPVLVNILLLVGALPGVLCGAVQGDATVRDAGRGHDQLGGLGLKEKVKVKLERIGQKVAVSLAAAKAISEQIHRLDETHLAESLAENLRAESHNAASHPTMTHHHGSTQLMDQELTVVKEKVARGWPGRMHPNLQASCLH